MFVSNYILDRPVCLTRTIRTYIIPSQELNTPCVLTTGGSLSKKILVSGATGATGREIIKRLVAGGHQTKAIVHKEDARSKVLAEQGVEIVRSDLLDLDSVALALQNVRAAYFVYPIQPGVVQATAYFAEAAREAGVEAIVNMSQINAHRHAVSNASRDHWIAQGLFDRCGIAVTHIRPTFFAEWYLYLAHKIKQGTLPLPLFKEGRHAPIVASDMATVIANILVAPESHVGKSYELVGPKAYNQLEIAEILGKEIGRRVSFEQVTEQNYLKDVLEGGVYVANTLPPVQEQSMADFLVQHLSGAKFEHQQGLLAATNDVIEKVGKITPTSLENFISSHIAAFE